MIDAWQPMSTAPRDGRAILLWDASRAPGYTADQRYAIGFCVKGGDHEDRWYDTRNGGGLYQLRAWRPLPEPFPE